MCALRAIDMTGKPTPHMLVNPSHVLPDGTPLAVNCSECGESFEIDREDTELTSEAIRAAFQAIFDEHLREEHPDAFSQV